MKKKDVSVEKKAEVSEEIITEFDNFYTFSDGSVWAYIAQIKDGKINFLKRNGDFEEYESKLYYDDDKRVCFEFMGQVYHFVGDDGFNYSFSKNNYIDTYDASFYVMPEDYYQLEAENLKSQKDAKLVADNKEKQRIENEEKINKQYAEEAKKAEEEKKAEEKKTSESSSTGSGSSTSKESDTSVSTSKNKYGNYYTTIHGQYGEGSYNWGDVDIDLYGNKNEGIAVFTVNGKERSYEYLYSELYYSPGEYILYLDFGMVEVQRTGDKWIYCELYSGKD